MIARLPGANIRAAAAGLLFAALALSMPHDGAAQAVAPPPDQNSPTGPSAEPIAAPNPPADKPDLLQEIGRWLQRGAATVRGQLDDTKKQLDDVNQNAATIGDAASEVGKTAAGVVVSPLTGRLITGHERCGTAPNGAPDCVTAAQELCKRHGYATGKSVDFTAAEQCSPTVYLAGRGNAPACVKVTFISRAMCQ